MAKFRTGEASRRLDCFEHHLRTLAKEGKIPFEDGSNGRLFDEADFGKIREALDAAGFKKAKRDIGIDTHMGDMSRPHLATMTEISAKLPLSLSVLFRLYHSGKLPEAITIDGWDEPFVPLDHTADPFKLRARLEAEGIISGFNRG